MNKYITVLLMLILAISIGAKAIHHDRPVITLAPDWELRVHRVSNVALSITNYGEIGSQGRGIYDPDTDTPAPSAEFPRGSGIDYLFFGALWIGGTVDDPDNPGTLDTLVSIAEDGWWSGINELNPGEIGQQSIWRRKYVGDDEILAEYFDTTIVGVTTDPNDERPHIPLGVKIDQHSYCWSTPGYDKFFVIEYNLQNILDRDIHDVWLGVYYDGDVFHISEDGYGIEEGAQDDLCGYIEHNGRGIGWLADNNGQPYNGEFTDSSATGVMGLMLLGSTVSDLQTNFNWWISNINSQYDWGPRESFYDDGPFAGGGYGTPGGDIAKYKVMSWDERDYDQAYSALDWTDNGWIENRFRDPNDVANGFDTRFLISFGSFDLPAGASETITLAYVAGSNFHTDPYNFAEHLLGHTDDSTSIAVFYDNLNFGDFFANADTALHYYSTDLANIPIGPPDNFKVQDWSADHVSLSWSPRQHPHLGGYHIYRGTSSGIYGPEPITPDNYTDTSFDDNNVEDNTVYYYMIKSANNNSLEGNNSSEISINTGQPLAPTGLAAVPGNNQAEVNWENNPEDDIAGYIIYRSPYYGPDSLLVVIDTSTVNSYNDYGLVNGYLYRYSIRALDNFGNQSFFSDTISVIPHNADSGILLVNANDRVDQFNPDYDSMIVFYNQLMQNTSEPFAIVDYPPQSLLDLANYRTVIWCAELIHDEFYFLGRDELISDYLDAGGNFILIGPKNTMTLSFNGLYNFGPYEFAQEYLNVDAVEYPRIQNTEFIGGNSMTPDYPDFNVDTARANRIIFPDGDNDGRLFGMGALVPLDSNEVLYTYRSVNPDTSNYEGEPIAVFHRGENYKTAFINFPLYYVEPPYGEEIFAGILQLMEATGIDDNPGSGLPDKTSLLQNYPNPFNANTTIKYELKKSAKVTISVYDILGRKVGDIFSGYRPAGVHSTVWQAAELSSGVYFYRIQAGDYSAIKKCVLLK